MRARITVLVLFTLAAAAACHSSTAPTTTTSTPTSTAATYLFQGTLDRGSSTTESYAASVGGPVKLTLANVSVDVNQPLAQALTLAVGSSDCAPTTTVQAMPALTAQLTGSVPAGTFCVIVSDPGSRLTQTVNFSLQVAVGTLTAAVTTAGTATWATSIGLGANGAATRLIPTFGAGTISLSLDSLSYPGGRLGLGLGIPGPGGVGCVAAQVTAGGPSTKISATVDAGIYCGQVYNVGATTGAVKFSTTISYP